MIRPGSLFNFSASGGGGGNLPADVITYSPTGGTGGIPALVITDAGFNQTLDLGTLTAGGGGVTVPYDFNIDIAEFDPGGLSDYRTFRSISEFFNSDSSDADKIYAQYQGLKFSGTGTGTVDVTYNFHGFTWLNGATNVSHLRGVFHHIPLEGSGSIVDAIDFEAGTNVYTSTGTIVSMIGFQTSDIGGSQVHSVIGFHAADTTADTNTAFTISSGTYNNGSGLIVLTVTPLVTVGLLQSVTLSGLTGTGAFASLNGTWLTAATTGQFTISLSATPGLGASTITGGTATVPLGGVTSFLSEQTGASNFAFKSTGDAAVLFGGAQIQVGNVTWQGTQTSMSQNYTLSRALGSTTGVQTAMTAQTSFSSSAAADVRGFAITALPSGSTNITQVIATPVSITNASTGTTATSVGVASSTTLNAAGSTTTARGMRTTFQLSSSGNITTAVNYLADAPTLSSTGAISTMEGFTANVIGHASLVTNARGFRMLDTSAVTEVSAFRGEVTSGTGKKNLNMTGNADNYIAGAVQIDGSLTSLGATAVGAGANTQAFIKASSTANLGLYYGTGDPAFVAAKGSVYSKTNASTTTSRLWVNTDGSTTWANFTASA